VAWKTVILPQQLNKNGVFSTFFKLMVNKMVVRTMKKVIRGSIAKVRS